MSAETEDFIEHFGVKGMKWGQRKNSDHKAAVKVARKEAYDKSFSGFGKHKVRNGGAVAVAGLLTGGLAAANVATIPMIHAQGYSKGKSVALGLIGGPVSLVVVSELSARKNAKA